MSTFIGDEARLLYTGTIGIFFRTRGRPGPLGFDILVDVQWRSQLYTCQRPAYQPMAGQIRLSYRTPCSIQPSFRAQRHARGLPENVRHTRIYHQLRAEPYFLQFAVRPLYFTDKETQLSPNGRWRHRLPSGYYRPQWEYARRIPTAGHTL